MTATVGIFVNEIKLDIKIKLDNKKTQGQIMRNTHTTYCTYINRERRGCSTERYSEDGVPLGL